MKNNIKFSDKHTQCYGNFSIADPICKKACAIALQCAIEQRKDMNMKILDELLSDKNIYLKMQ